MAMQPDLRKSMGAHAALWYWVLPVLLVVTFMGFSGANRDFLWWDEELNYQWVTGTPDQPANLLSAVLGVAKDRVWPPAHTIVLYGWIQLTGNSLFAARALTVLTGLLAVSVMYRVGRSLISPMGGVLCAILLGTSAYFIYYTHEMRGYSQYLLFVSLTVWWYWRLLHKSKPITPRSAYVLTFAMVGAIYSHYIAFAFCAMIGLYHILFQRKHPQYQLILRHMIFAGLLFIPWLPVMSIGIFLETIGIKRSIGLPHIVLDSLYAYGNGFTLALVVALIYVLIVRRTPVLFYILFWAVGSTIVAILLDIPITYLVNIRHLYFLLPFAILILAMALDDIFQRNGFPHSLLKSYPVGTTIWRNPQQIRRWLGMALLVLWCVAGVYFGATNDFMKALQNYVRPLPMSFVHDTQAIQSCAADEDVTLLHLEKSAEEWLNINLIERIAGTHNHQTATLGRMTPNATDAFNAQPDGSYAARVANMTANAPTVWLLEMADRHTLDPEAIELQALLHEQYAYCGQISRNDATIIYAYSQQPNLNCTNAITLPTCAPDLLMQP
jgi:hypothetical protein